MTHVFWEKGYEGASYDDLVKGTGVQRYGLYNTFGDKRSTFIHCLNFYVNEVVRKFTKPLRHEGAGLKEIRDYFDALLQVHTDDAWGCLACNSVSEKISDTNKEVKDMITSMFTLAEESFRHALQGAQNKGEISKDLNITTTVHHLLGTAIGSAVMARASIDKQTIRDFIDTSYGRLAA